MESELTYAEHKEAATPLTGINNPNIEPSHYTEMKISPLEYNKANNIGWNVGNVIKYISRYKNKNGLEDLKKAQWYLNDLIRDVEAENE